jgi:hypothetical protein
MVPECILVLLPLELAGASKEVEASSYVEEAPVTA